MTPSPEAEALLAELPRRGFPAAEIFEKQGRSRSFTREGAASTLAAPGAAVVPAAGVRMTQAVATEAGWALRAGDRRRSLFHAATGSADPGVTLPEPSPHPLRLPDPAPAPAPDLGSNFAANFALAGAGGPSSAAEDFDAPLATESAAATLLAEIERELRRELPESRLVTARLEDGAAEWTLLSTTGVRAASRARAAYLRLEVEDRGRRCCFEGAERDIRRFEPRALALRLVDRLCALEGGRDGASAAPWVNPDLPLLLAAPLAARLVQAIAPLFLGAAASDRLAAMAGSAAGAGSGALSPGLTLIDDGQLPGGVLVSPVDGEGLPCGRAVLIDDGRFVQPLLAWWEAGGSPVPGCARRASWRDLPRRAPTHFFIAPSTTPVADLLAAGGAGAYLLDAEGAVRIDPASLAFAVAVSGFHLSSGRAISPLGRVRLCGDVRSLLAGLRALARDLSFVPGDGMFGAPSMLVSGLRVLPG